MLTRKYAVRFIATLALLAQTAGFAAICGCGTAVTEMKVAMHCGHATSGPQMVARMSCCCDEKSEATTKSVVTLSPDFARALHETGAEQMFALHATFVHWKAAGASARRTFAPPRPPLRV